MRAIAVAAAAAAGLAIGASAPGAIVEVNFTGTVSSVFGTGVPPAPVGSTFTGTFQYDSNGPVFNPEGGGGAQVISYHSMLSYSVTFDTSGGPDEGIITFIAGTVASDEFFETVTNDQLDFDGRTLIDSYRNRVGSHARDLSGNIISTLSWGIFLNSRSGGPLTSAALPTSLNLSDWDLGTFSMDNVEDQFGLPTPTGNLTGNLTSLTSTIIPSPSAGALMAIGGLAALRRRRA